MLLIKKLAYLCKVNKAQNKNKTDMKTLKDIQVKNTVTVTTEMMEQLKNTQEWGKRYFNEQPFSLLDMQLSINKLQEKQEVLLITDGENILISVNARIWDGVSILSN